MKTNKWLRHNIKPFTKRIVYKKNRLQKESFTKRIALKERADKQKGLLEGGEGIKAWLRDSWSRPCLWKKNEWKDGRWAKGKSQANKEWSEARLKTNIKRRNKYGFEAGGERWIQSHDWLTAAHASFPSYSRLSIPPFICFRGKDGRYTAAVRRLVLR